MNNKQHGISLNFFPLATDNFTITLYRLPYVESSPPIIKGEEAVRRYLVVDGVGDYYWTLFQRPKNGTEIVCGLFDNSYLTIAALRLALIERCTKNLEPNQFEIVGGFRKRVEILIEKHDEGRQVISLEPYLLRSRGKFGFLANFRFHPTEGHIGTQRALELSLSLDKNGKKNSAYYADRYSQLTSYAKKFHHQIFPLTVPRNQRVDVEPILLELDSVMLDPKNYIVGSGNESSSQFIGIKRFGPFKQAEDTHLYFLYKQQDRPLANDLFRALRGDTFGTFPGMKRMFRVPTLKENVNGTTLSDFSTNEIERIRDRVVKDAGIRNVVPIVLTPFSKHDTPEKNAEYWSLKHAFLSDGMPIQVVSTNKIAEKDELKWATASIGLQVFAKLGGKPWKVRPRTERCLIVGIGQAHRQFEDHIERFFAYSVLTDSSGVFEDVKVLAEANEEDEYIRSFSTSLREIFQEYSSRFSSFVVHSTFSIRRRELESIASALEEQKNQQAHPGEFVSLKFNDRNKFFGFAVNHNTRVPYESTVVRLSSNEFLVWFEGLQYRRPVVRETVGGPLHVRFTYPQDGLTRDQQIAHLQDAINLSGANWRGFNAKSLPVSVYYAQLIAKYLKEFENHGLPPVDVGIFKPWFL